MRNLRRFLAMALTIMMVAGCFSMFSVNAFDDVYDFETAINTLSDLGVIKGYDETTFGPDDDVLRWHMALLVSKLVTGKVETATWETASNYTNFTDVAAENYYGSISYAANHGIIIGTSATTFEPNGQIMFQDALTMVVRALGLGSDAMDAGYPYTYIAKANKLDLTEGLEYIESYEDYLTRGETAQLLYNALYVVDEDGVSLGEKVFGFEAAATDIVVITATNNANLESDVFVEKTDYVAFNSIMTDGTLNENVTYFINKAAFGIEGDADLYLGASYKVLSNDGYKTFTECEAIEAVAVEVEGFASKNTALVKIDGTEYQIVESYTALNSTGVNRGNYPEIIMIAKDSQWNNGAVEYVTNANGDLLDAKGQIVAYYMPALVGYANPYVVYDGTIVRAATAADLAKAALVNGSTVSANKLITDTAAEIANVGAIYDAVAYDDNGDGIYDRAFYRNYKYGQYVVDANNVVTIGNDATGAKADAIKVIDAEGNATTVTPNGYYVYAYNYQSKTLVIKEALTVQTGYVSGINTLKSNVTIGGTVYSYGIANLPNAAAAQVGVGPEIVGKNVNFVLVDGVVVDILNLTDLGYIVVDSVIGVTSSGLPTVLVYNNSNIASVIVVATVDTYSYYQFNFNTDALNPITNALVNRKGDVFTAEIDALGYYHLNTVAGIQTATADFSVDFINGVTNNQPAIGGQFKTTADTIILVYNTVTKTFTARKGIPADGAVLTVATGAEYFVKTAGNAITYIYVKGDAAFTGTTTGDAWGTTTMNTTVVYVDPAYAEPTIVSNSLSSIIGVEGLALQGYTYKYTVVDLKTGKNIEVLTASYNAQLVSGGYYYVTNGYVEKMVDTNAVDSPIKSASILSIAPFYSETTVGVYDRQEVVILAIDPIMGTIVRDATTGEPKNFFADAAYTAANTFAMYYDVNGTTKVYLTANQPIGCPVQLMTNGTVLGSVGNWAYGTEATDANGTYVSAGPADPAILVFYPHASMDFSQFFASATGTLHLEIYVEDASAVTYGQFELYTTSCDQDERGLNVPSLNLKDGWNTIEVPANSLYTEGAKTFNPAAIGGSRLYMGGGQITMAVRNIYFYDDGTVHNTLAGADAPEVPDEPQGPVSTVVYGFTAEETGNFWTNGTSAARETFEGKEAYRISSGTVACGNLKDAGANSLDLSGYDYLTIDVYVSNAETAGTVTVDITSVKDGPTPEYNCKYQFTGLTNGWNTLVLSADKVTATGDNFNAATVYFTHVYISATIDVLAIANLCGVVDAQ